MSERRDINTGGGNYNENIEGDYIHGDYIHGDKNIFSENSNRHSFNLRVLTSWFGVSLFLTLLVTIANSTVKPISLLDFLVYIGLIFFVYSAFGFIGILVIEPLKGRSQIRYTPSIWAIYPIIVLIQAEILLFKIVWQIVIRLPSIW